MPILGSARKNTPPDGKKPPTTHLHICPSFLSPPFPSLSYQLNQPNQSPHFVQYSNPRNHRCPPISETLFSEKPPCSRNFPVIYLPIRVLFLFLFLFFFRPVRPSVRPVSSQSLASFHSVTVPYLPTLLASRRRSSPFYICVNGSVAFFSRVIDALVVVVCGCFPRHMGSRVFFSPLRFFGE